MERVCARELQPRVESGGCQLDEVRGEGERGGLDLALQQQAHLVRVRVKLGLGLGLGFGFGLGLGT